MQDSNPGYQTPNRQQTECPLTNRLSCRGSSWKPTAHPHDQRAFSPPEPTTSWLSHLFRWYTCLLLLISILWHRQAIFESKGDKLSPSAECRIRTQGLRHQIASRLYARWQTDWAVEDQAENHVRRIDEVGGATHNQYTTQTLFNFTISCCRHWPNSCGTWSVKRS